MFEPLETTIPVSLQPKELRRCVVSGSNSSKTVASKFPGVSCTVRLWSCWSVRTMLSRWAPGNWRGTTPLCKDIPTQLACDTFIEVVKVWFSVEPSCQNGTESCWWIAGMVQQNQIWFNWFPSHIASVEVLAALVSDGVDVGGSTTACENVIAKNILQDTIGIPKMSKILELTMNLIPFLTASHSYNTLTAHSRGEVSKVRNLKERMAFRASMMARRFNDKSKSGWSLTG